MNLPILLGALCFHSGLRRVMWTVGLQVLEFSPSRHHELKSVFEGSVNPATRLFAKKALFSKRQSNRPRLNVVS